MNSKNRNMHKAKKLKNDEFYTQLSDIEKELGHYRHLFTGKSIYLNCDNPNQSEFWQYFYLSFKYFGLKKLTATYFDEKNQSYKSETIDGKTIIKTLLKQNGDFRSSESIANLEECDLVITNPPFSLFREFVSQLIEYDKKFIIVGNMNAITYKEIFKFIKDNKIWLGHSAPKLFLQPNGTFKKFGNIKWFTNIKTSKQSEELILYKKYYGNENLYPKYDNYDAINIDKVKDIPCDYDGIMGVPITFLDKFNSEQFEILGMANSARWISQECFTIVNGINKYNRFIIKKKHK